MDPAQSAAMMQDPMMQQMMQQMLSDPAALDQVRIFDYVHFLSALYVEFRALNFPALNFCSAVAEVGVLSSSVA